MAEGIGGRELACSPLIGAGLHDLRDQLRTLAHSGSPLLLCGATGTGKTVVARWVHELSRPSEPFVSVNCAGFPDTLVESQLFGHERGAFTDAGARFVGAFAEAAAGTIFLDEIGEMPMPQQAKLLQAIELRTARRLGSTGEYRIHARILAATNIDLEAGVREKRFRSDLYYRFGLPVRIPSLDEHPADIPEIVTSLLPRLEVPPVLGPDAVEWIASQEWPGNVRELRMLLDRAGILACGAPVDARFLARLRVSSSGTVPVYRPIDKACRELEEKMAREALQQHGGNVSATAKYLRVSRNYLKKLVGSSG